jgi:hypothetical protein
MHIPWHPASLFIEPSVSVYERRRWRAAGRCDPVADAIEWNTKGPNCRTHSRGFARMKPTAYRLDGAIAMDFPPMAKEPLLS